MTRLDDRRRVDVVEVHVRGRGDELVTVVQRGAVERDAADLQERIVGTLADADTGNINKSRDTRIAESFHVETNLQHSFR